MTQIRVAPSTRADVNNGQPFPPLVAYVGLFDEAAGELQRAFNYIGSAIACMQSAAQQLTGSYTPNQQIDPSTVPGVAQQLAYAATWLEGARTVLHNIQFGCPCPVAFDQARWDLNMGNYFGLLGQILAVNGSGNYTVLGSFDLATINGGAVISSSWLSPLQAQQATLSAGVSNVNSSPCQNNTNPGGSGGGDLGGGGRG